VHLSGVPWDDDSGERLRGWLGLDEAAFYNPALVALIPMGFCYPGARKGGDAPPRRECAPLWHERVMSLLPARRLTLLVGAYAQIAYLPDTRKLTMTERVRRADTFAPFFPLPHPAWRSRLWMAKRPWFEEKILPILRQAVAQQLR
jgi:uracil-DNA glycosylase